MIFKSLDVWQRLNDFTAVHYRCFQIGEGQAFCVQSRDVYHLPLNEKQMSFFGRQFVELLCEEAPNNRSGVYPTLLQAIQAFDEDFEEADMPARSSKNPVVNAATEYGFKKSAETLGVSAVTVHKQLDSAKKGSKGKSKDRQAPRHANEPK
jgi:hypothetical protein